MTTPVVLPNLPLAIHGTLISTSSGGQRVLIERAVLENPRAALSWLDDAFVQHEIDGPFPRARRAVIRRLRRDLQGRSRWLDGDASRPYVVHSESYSSDLEGCLYVVKKLPLVTPCLLLERAP